MKQLSMFIDELKMGMIKQLVRQLYPFNKETDCFDKYCETVETDIRGILAEIHDIEDE